MIHKDTYVLAAVVLLDAALAAYGLRWLMMPPIYKVVWANSPFFLYQGHILIILALLLAWFHRWAVRRLLWLCELFQRWIFALMMMGVVGLETVMHILGIPHIEGWWMPLCGGSAALGVTVSKLHKWRKHH